MISLFSEIPNSLCLPFFDPTGTIWMIKLFTALISILNLISLIFITTVSWYIICVIKISCQLKDKKKETSMKSVGKLGIAPLSHILTWLPANVAYISALLMPRYPLTLTFWITALVMPINSIIHPIVFLTRA